MRDDEEWRHVWAAMTDEELEDRLFTYYWLARNTRDQETRAKIQKHLAAGRALN